MNTNRAVDKFLRDLLVLGLNLFNVHNIPFTVIQSKLSNNSAQNSWDALSKLKKEGYATEALISLERLKEMNVHPREYNDYWALKWTDKGREFLKEWQVNHGSEHR